MLSQLFIKNVAVIENAEVDFSKGFNVFTGETGAGKSILIDSINAVLGGRTSRDLIRTGESKAVVKAVFSDVSDYARKKIEDLGFAPDENGDYLVTREISAEGKNVCRVNMEPATAGFLKEISGYLIDIHGQHDSISLQNSDFHINYIDSYGETEKEYSAYLEAYHELHRIDNEIKKLSRDDSEKSQRIDMLKYQISEIENAEIEEGEDEKLETESRKIKASEEISSVVNESLSLLRGSDSSDGITDSVRQVSRNNEYLTEFYPQFRDITERLESIYYDLDEYYRDLDEINDGLDFDPRMQDRIESRLDQLYRLKKKYGGSLDSVMKYYADAKEELDSIEFSEERLEKLETERKKASDELEKRSSVLSEQRHKAASLFESSVMNELSYLNMPNVSFSVNFTETDYTELGNERLEFYISTNIGEPLKPLAKIASGGELSRIMLSIKNVLADKDNIDTLIFDEIDTGISGAAAMKVGKKLKQVSEGRQIICVTHLAQVAAYADSHLLISKSTRNDRTFTDVECLDHDGRLSELARIMGGTVTDSLIESAEELLNEASLNS